MATTTKIAGLVRRPSVVSQIVDNLVERMKAGAILPGQRFPSGEQLSKEFSVSRASVRSALNILATRGLITRRNGIGVFAAPLFGIHNSLNDAVDFFEMFRNYGFIPEVENAQLRTELPSEIIQNALNLAPDEQVLVSQKKFQANNDPKVFCHVYLSKSVIGSELTKRLEADPSANDSLFAFLDERPELKTKYVLSDLDVGRAENCPFPDLPLDRNAPMLIIRQVGYGPNEKPVWCTHEYYPEDSFRFGVVRRRV
jgi:GntR family transcriptional regulator